MMLDLDVNGGVVEEAVALNVLLCNYVKGE